MGRPHSIALCLLAVSAVSGWSPAAAQTSPIGFQTKAYGVAEGLRWEETLSDGTRLVKELGPRFGIGVRPRLTFRRLARLHLEADVRVLAGIVTYDGLLRTTEQELIPWSTRTAYDQAEGRLTAGVPLALPRRFRLVPSAGAGLEWWHRDLDNGGKRGYDEWFTVWFAQAGLTGEFDVSDRTEGFVTVLGSRPWSLDEKLDFTTRGKSGPSDLHLEPGIETRVEIRAGMRVSALLFEASFERWTLPRSPSKQGYFQPDSKRHRLGLHVGYVLGR